MNDLNQFEQQDFTTDYLGDGTRYRLPMRRLGRVRHLGWIVVAFGIIATIFSVAWTWGTVLGGWDQIAKGGLARWLTIGFGGVGLFIFAQGLMIFCAGVAVIRNGTRCEIDVRGGKIAVRERASFFRLRRKCAASDIHRLRIVNVNEAMKGKQSIDTQLWLGDCDSALMADVSRSRKFPIAVGYPRDLLIRLAEELAPRLQADWNTTSATLTRAPGVLAAAAPRTRNIEVVEGLEDSNTIAIVPEQPAGTIVTIDRRPFGITIDVPPVGLMKGSKGLFIFAILWNSFTSVFLVLGVLGVSGAIEMEGDGPPWIMFAVILPFVAVGVAMTIISVNMGRRHATIATADDQVMIVRHSIFGKSTREWSSSQIKEICCGDSGMEVNNVPVKELQVIPSDGKKFGCLSQLDEAELIWIAAELNQALAIQHRSGPENGDPSI